MSIESLLEELEARLPELEWKIRALDRIFFSSKSLPQGLFRVQANAPAAAFITEVKKDIQALAGCPSERSGYYLAQRIHQKINVLVNLYRIHVKEVKTEASHPLDSLCTRQQLIGKLEEEVERLSIQRDAVKERLLHKYDAQMLLTIKNELGLVEKRLTVAKEALSNATKW
ncbi:MULTISPECIES: hypothetical protein [unclassified Legionella]|uniref:hypothetical protein n=1 Tax=unclassified Legionella TaxID=2622702 RepID=UPI0010554756|nr:MULTISPECIES: hypothetical protein [unclassified Legionella]MDI9818911.1 hypothetical protein [Legionella sp. PL877]